VSSPAGLRVAVVGNGGAGKSVVSGTLARLLARRGRQVLAVDLDPNPGLAFSLGLPVVDAGLPAEALEQRDDRMYGWGLARHIDPSTGAERFGLPAADGVRYLTPGAIDRPDHAVSRSHSAVAEIVEATPASWDVVADVEAGTTRPAEGGLPFATCLVLVVTPARKSAMAARRIRWLLPDRAALIVTGHDDGSPAHEGLTPHVRVPHDPAVAAAERAGRAPLDACPDSPVIAAVTEIADLLLSGKELS
jgi:CO dehydrogenase maturation factor